MGASGPSRQSAARICCRCRSSHREVLRLVRRPIIGHVIRPVQGSFLYYPSRRQQPAALSAFIGALRPSSDGRK